MREHHYLPPAPAQGELGIDKQLLAGRDDALMQPLDVDSSTGGEVVGPAVVNSHCTATAGSSSASSSCLQRTGLVARSSSGGSSSSNDGTTELLQERISSGYSAGTNPGVSSTSVLNQQAGCGKVSHDGSTVISNHSSEPRHLQAWQYTIGDEPCSSEAPCSLCQQTGWRSLQVSQSSVLRSTGLNKMSHWR